MAALGCATANAQEINAVVARQSNTTQEMVRLTNTPNVILNENGITLKEGETNVENYSFNDGNVTVLFASAINSTESTESLTHPKIRNKTIIQAQFPSPKPSFPLPFNKATSDGDNIPSIFYSPFKYK